jgi:alkylation response protein AidB-like acyl-CoA dehydrogenase
VEQPVEVRAAFRRWLETATPPDLVRDDRERFAQRIVWQRELFDAGWMGLGWPEEYGGRGGEPADKVMIYEELAAAGAPAPGGIIGLDIAGPLLLVAGSEDQKLRYLPPLIRGDEVWCQCFSEPEAGSDLAAVRTVAVDDAASEGFVVDGHKIWTSEGAFAQRGILLCRTGPVGSRHRGLSLLVVDMATPGVTVRPIVGPMGDSEFGEVYFDGVAVPREDLIGQLDGGWPLAMSTLEFERGPYALRRRIELARALNDVVAECVSRDGMLDDPVTVARIGRCRALVDVLAAQAPSIMARIAAPSSRGESSLDKLLLAEAEQAVFGTALDLLGPDRMLTGEDGVGLTRWQTEWFHSRSASVYGGSAEIQRTIISDRLLDLPRAAQLQETR